MTIAKRLIILLAVPLLAILGLGVLSALQLSELANRSRYVAEKQIPSLASLGNVTRTFVNLRINVRDHLLTTNPSERAKAHSEFDQNELRLTQLLSQYAGTLVSDEKDRRLLDEYRDQSRNWIDGAKQVMAVAEEGRREEAVARLYGSMGKLGENLENVSIEWIQHNEALAAAASKAAVESALASRRNLLIAAFVALALSAGLGILTFRRIVVPIWALDTSVKTIAAGDYAKDVPFTTASDETGGLARSIAILKQGAAAMEEQRWVKTNAAKLAGDLQGAASLAEFGQRLLSGLMPVLGGGVAGFYRFEEDLRLLRRIAAYGLADSAASADSFRLGEGLVGQCAQERKSVTLTDLPPGYLQIASGLGAAAPVQAVALPLLSEKSLLGVLEIASFHGFNAQQKTLLEEILPVAAMSLEVLQSNLETQELLSQTQEQSRQLEEQTVELTQSQEELLAQKEELLTQQSELTAQRERLRETEQFFRSVLELAPDALMVVDEKGSFSWLMRSVKNSSVTSATSWSVNRWKCSFPIVFARGIPSCASRITSRRLYEAWAQTVNYRALQKDGSLVPVEIGLSPIAGAPGRKRASRRIHT